MLGRIHSLGQQCNGEVVLSDTHFGDLENGQADAVLELIYDATLYAIEQRAGMVFAGDTFDFYPYADEQKRMEDSGILCSCMSQLVREKLPITFLDGNHDPDITEEQIQKYTLLQKDQFECAGDFYMPSSEVLITHGHKIQLMNISKLSRRFRKQLIDISNIDHASILQWLEQDEELIKESKKVDAYYQNGVDHPEKRWRTQWLHGLIMLLQSSRGYASAQLGKAAQHFSQESHPQIFQEICQWLASGCRLSLTHRALRFAKFLHIPIIVCGHNHVPQIEVEDLKDANGKSTHIYANSGSAYQRNQINTIVHIRREEGETGVHLLQHAGGGNFIQTDAAQYGHQDRQVTS